MVQTFSLSGTVNNLAIKNYYSEKAAPKGSFMWTVSKTPNPSIHSITVFAKECPMVFPKVAGVLSLNYFDIVDVRNYRQNKNSLGTFKVQALKGNILKEEDFKRAEQCLKAVLSGRLNLEQAFRQKMSDLDRTKLRNSASDNISVEVNNDNSFLFSLIEVSADDFPGILYKISDAVMKSGLDIWNAHIETNNKKIQDVFYVKDLKGRKLEQEQIITVVSRVKKALSD
ncbi:hypothetical protein QUF70_06430 [Desulfobacterales bacterium HSG17]|nr:hypothetical protein [Desulfobacterales bacterium HSG17]